MTIDWGAAPEGTTHFQPENERLRASWIKVEGGCYWFRLMTQSNWVRYSGPVIWLGDLVQRPTVWGVDGLPPIGQHVHIYDPEGLLMYGAGEDGEVIAHIEDTAVVRMSYGLGCFVAKHLRTAEQIAADEQKAEIAEIESLIMNHWETLNVHDLATTIYEANYRKVTP